MKLIQHALIPNKLRTYRKQAGLRQLDVANKLGFCTTDRISHWEKGFTFPHIINLFRLCALYKVQPHELYSELLEEVGRGNDMKKYWKSK